jgi:hypothetical protein
LKKPGSDLGSPSTIIISSSISAWLTPRDYGPQPLGVVIQSAKIGDLFCSTETLASAGDDVYEKDTRVKNRVILPYEDRDVYLEFGTDHFVASTGKLEQVETLDRSGTFRNLRLFINPLIMGAPSLGHPINKKVNIDLAVCRGRDTSGMRYCQKTLMSLQRQKRVRAYK